MQRELGNDIFAASLIAAMEGRKFHIKKKSARLS